MSLKPTKAKRVKPPSPQERAILQRMLLEESLHDFVKGAWHILEPETPFIDNWHIVALCQHLEAVSAGKIEQFMGNVPPGTMKSLLTCVFWPAWEWATKPGKRFMFSSYAETLSIRDSIKRRTLINSEWYQERWPTVFTREMDTHLENDRGGWCIVGSITGKGIGQHPDYNVADDPHNVLQAESDVERMTVTRWFEGVFCVRGVVRNVKRVLIMQRLHAKDCCGIALDKGGWTVLCLPMRFELSGHMSATTRERPTSLGFYDPRTDDGELLWPAVYTERKVANLEVNMGTYTAAGQLQQRPSPRGGGKFKRANFAIMPTMPPGITKYVRYWDKAGTKGGSGAETATVLMAEFACPTEVLPAMRRKYVILDAEAFREQASEREKRIQQKAITDRQLFGHVETWVEQEPGSGGLESAQGTVANNPGFSFKMERVTGSKEVRCDPLASQSSVGKVFILAAVWNEKLLGELEMFPMGKLKDLVDASGGAFNKLTAGTGAFDNESLQGAYSGGGQGSDSFEFPHLDISM